MEREHGAGCLDSHPHRRCGICRLGRDGGCTAGSPAWPRWHADPDSRLRGLLQGCSWSELVATSPMTAKYMSVLFRMYGVFNVVFGLMAIAITVTAFRRGERWAWWALLVGNTIAFVSAMTYDRTVNAIGPFELSEYLGLAIIYGALAVTAPFLLARRRVRVAG